MTSYSGDPRVIMQVVDMSHYLKAITTGWTLMMGQCERGTPFQPYYFSDEASFEKHCGGTVDWSRDPLTVLTTLGNKGRVIFIRLVHCSDPTDKSTMDAACAQAPIPDRGGSPTHAVVTGAIGPYTFAQALSGRLTGAELGPYTIVTGANDVFKCRIGVEGTWEADQTVTLTSGTRTAQEICDDINAGTSGLNATVVGNAIYIEVIDVAKGIEILNATNECWSTLGMVEAVYPPTAGTDSLTVEISGGGDQAFDLEPLNGETGSFVLTATEVVAQLTGLVGGTASVSSAALRITSTGTGTDAWVQVKAASTADTPLGLDNTVHTGTAGEQVEAWGFKLKGPGSWANGGKVFVYQHPLIDDAINIRVALPDTDEEYFDELYNDPNSERYWKTWLNLYSTLIDVIDLDEPNDYPLDWPALTNVGYAFAGGTDGSQVLTDADYVGDAAARTGIYACEDAQLPVIDIMPLGTTSATVATALNAWATARIGKMVHCQVPDVDATVAVTWRNGTPPDFAHAAFNSPNLSLMYGFPKVLDVRNNLKTEIPALAHLAALITQNDDNYGPQQGPFGPKYGRCEGVQAMDRYVRESSAEADLFAEHGINDMRILSYNQRTSGWEGVVLWGNYTSQKSNSAFREFNVTRLIKKYELSLLPALFGYIFSPNHPVTWGEIYREIVPFFRREVEKYAIYGFFVQTDKDAYFSGGELKGAILNTGADIDMGVYRMRILIQPTRLIRYLECQIGVTKTGQPWSDYNTLYTLPGWVRNV